jgi:hypothetical protein
MLPGLDGSGNVPGMQRVSFLRAALLAGLIAGLAACLLAGCKPAPPVPTLYENKQVGLRFNPSPGWDVAEKTEAGCAFAVEATKGQDLHFLICISPPRPEILFTENTFVSCENVKEYIRQALKGVRPTCDPGGAGGHFGYDTLYARLLQSGDRARVQFVNHLFMPVKGRLVQVMAYSIGDDDKKAHALFDKNRPALFDMMGSVRVR